MYLSIIQFIVLHTPFVSGISVLGRPRLQNIAKMGGDSAPSLPLNAMLDKILAKRVPLGSGRVFRLFVRSTSISALYMYHRA